MLIIDHNHIDYPSFLIFFSFVIFPSFLMLSSASVIDSSSPFPLQNLGVS